MKVPPRGNPHARIMLVGEAPGAVEDAQGKPFVGPAGGMLTSCLLQAGIDPDEVYYTNLCKYRPAGNDFETLIPKGVPSDALLEGLEELQGEIALVNPNVIVPLGNWPLWAFYKQVATGISDYRGYVLEARKLAKGRKLIPTFHPSYLLRGAFAEIPLSVLDLGKVRIESTFPEVRRKDRTVYIDPQGAQREVLRQRLLTEGRWLCIDIEYTGRMLCIGFSVSSDWAVTFPIRSRLDMEFCRSLAESGRPLIAQNAMFDCGILEYHYNWNIFDHLVGDTMVAAYNLNIEYPKDLGWLAGMYTDLFPWWENVDAAYWKRVREGKENLDTLYVYNGYDNMSTYEIFEKQQAELDSDPKIREAFNFDMAKIKPLWETARRGVLLNTSKILEIKAKAVDDAEESQLITNAYAEGAGIDLKGLDLNVKSKTQVVKYLQRFDVRFVKKTPPSSRFPAGQFMDDNKTLMELMRKATHPKQTRAIEHVLRVREARDIQSKFTEIEWDTDLRARCIYDATKTTTRRLSSKKFFPTGKGTNLQNIPAPSSSQYGGPIRCAFIPDPGFEFGYADLKGAEFLVVAELTQDPLMLRYAQMTIDGSGDVHKETASYLFHLPVAEIGKESVHRFLGKKTRHSGNYMVGWKEFMSNINKDALDTGVWIDAAMAKKLINGYVSLHPGLRSWWDETEAEVRRYKKLRNLFGFVRRFNGNIGQILPVAVAFVPQSTIGDYLNFGLLACANDQELKELGFQLLLQVHDAIGFQYPIHNRDYVLPRVRRLMDIGVRIPKTGRILNIPVEIVCGPSWGEGKEYKLDLVKAA